MLTLCGLHGLFGRPDHWRRLRAALAASHRVLAPSLPLTLEAAAEGVPALSRFVVAWLAAKGVDRAVLVGNSFGGLVALDVALRYPGRAGALVLTGSAGLLERGIAAGVPASPSPEFIRRHVEEVFHDPAHATDALVLEIHDYLRDRTRRRAMVRWARATRGYSMAGRLGGVRAPTLLVWGEEDRITPLSVAEAFREGLPDALLVTIPRCGHAPMLEAPDAFAAHVRAFLAFLETRDVAAGAPGRSA